MNCVQAAAMGDVHAFGELVHDYQHAVFRVCLKMTGNKADAEDLAQEVFIKAYHALPGFRQDASFSTWLYQIAVRKCLDYKRALTRERQRRTDSPVELVDVADSQSPEGFLMEQQRTDTLLALVRGLKEPYRTVTQLFYFEECSCQEIASRLGTPVKTVESQLYRARRMMRAKGDGLR